MKQQGQKPATIFAKFTAAFSIFSTNRGPSTQEVKQTLNGAREDIASLQEVRREASKVHAKTQEILSQAREASGPQG